MYEPLGVKDVRIKQFIEMYNLDAHFFRCEMCIEMWNVQSNWGFRSSFFECYEFTLEAPSMAALAA